MCAAQRVPRTHVPHSAVAAHISAQLGTFLHVKWHKSCAAHVCWFSTVTPRAHPPIHMYGVCRGRIKTPIKRGSDMSAGWAGGSTTRWRRLRAWVLDRDGYKCMVVLDGGCTVDAPLEGGHVDHIVPLSLGGDKYDPDNCRASCAYCNLKRNRGKADPVPHRVVSQW